MLFRSHLASPWPRPRAAHLRAQRHSASPHQRRRPRHPGVAGLTFCVPWGKARESKASLVAEHVVGTRSLRSQTIPLRACRLNENGPDLLNAGFRRESFQIAADDTPESFGINATVSEERRTALLWLCFMHEKLACDPCWDATFAFETIHSDHARVSPGIKLAVEVNDKKTKPKSG